jgi:hypothetical protein
MGRAKTAETCAHYVAFDWEAMDAWYEEERVLAHPRDPYHRVDTKRARATYGWP